MILSYYLRFDFMLLFVLFSYYLSYLALVVSSQENTSSNELIKLIY